MATKSALDLYSPEYEILCWDAAIYMLKQEEAKRHRQLISAGNKVQEIVKDFLNGQDD